MVVLDCLYLVIFAFCLVCILSVLTFCHICILSNLHFVTDSSNQPQLQATSTPINFNFNQPQLQSTSTQHGCDTKATQFC